jgi:hypothetical protein
MLPILDRNSDGGSEYVFSPFSVNSVSKGKMAGDFQENLIDMATLSFSDHLQGTVSLRMQA